MFTKSQTICLAAAMLLGLVLRPGGALPKPDRLEIRDFFGHWAGLSVLENQLGANLPVRARDLDVVIRRQDEGFRICWTTLRADGAGEPIRTEWRFVFKPGGSRDTWQASDAGNVLNTRRGVWANLRGRTLTIFGIITNEDGYSSLHVYDRTLDEFGMRLEFLHTDRSQVLRSLSGRLKRPEAADSPYSINPGEPPESAPSTPVEDLCGDA